MGLAWINGIGLDRFGLMGKAWIVGNIVTGKQIGRASGRERV